MTDPNNPDPNKPDPGQAELDRPDSSEPGAGLADAAGSAEAGESEPAEVGGVATGDGDEASVDGGVTVRLPSPDQVAGEATAKTPTATSDEQAQPDSAELQPDSPAPDSPAPDSPALADSSSATDAALPDPTADTAATDTDTDTDDTGTGTGTAGAPAVAPRRLSTAGALIWLLIALFGFTLVVQLRSNGTDQGMAGASQEDLVRSLSELESREQRQAAEIATLEASQRQLTSGVLGRQVALDEAEKRANELGLLAGTLQARGPGLQIAITPGPSPIKSSAILNTVQELRGAGGEVMQLAGQDGTVVRVVASTSFVDSGDGVLVDGVRLVGPYLLTVIGDPQTMKTALNIPGGVVASVGNAGGTVIPQERNPVEVTAVRRAGSLQYARPVS